MAGLFRALEVRSEEASDCLVKVRCCFLLFKNCSGRFCSVVLGGVVGLCFYAVMGLVGFVCFLVFSPRF